MSNKSSWTPKWAYPALWILVVNVCVVNLVGQNPAASVSGLVVNADGAPLFDANVRLTRRDRGVVGHDSNAKSDGQGRFVFLGLRAGEYMLTISHQNFGPLNQRLLSLSEESRLNLTIEMGRACANVSDAERYELSEADKAEIVSLALKEAVARLSIDVRRGKLILSSQNLSGATLSLGRLLGVSVASPETIERQAEEKGDFTYLRVSEFKQVGPCIAVTVEETWSAGKDSAGGNMSGSGVILEFLKKDGKWLGERVLEWVS